MDIFSKIIYFGNKKTRYARVVSMRGGGRKFSDIKRCGFSRPTFLTASCDASRDARHADFNSYSILHCLRLFGRLAQGPYY